MELLDRLSSMLRKILRLKPSKRAQSVKSRAEEAAMRLEEVVTETESIQIHFHASA